jgi:hypothetical protein
MGADGTGLTIDFDGFGDLDDLELDLGELDDAGFTDLDDGSDFGGGGGGGGGGFGSGGSNANKSGSEGAVDQSRRQLLLRESRIAHLDGFDLLHVLADGLDGASLFLLLFLSFFLFVALNSFLFFPLLLSSNSFLFPIHVGLFPLSF